MNGIRIVLFLLVVGISCCSHQSPKTSKDSSNVLNSKSEGIDDSLHIRETMIYKRLIHADRDYQIYDSPMELYIKKLFMKNGLIEKEYLYENNPQLTSYQYDIHGNLICWLRTREENWKGGKYYRIDYTFDSKNRLTKETHYRDVHYDSISLWSKMEYFYNGNDSVSKILHSGYNNLSDIKSIVYDSKKRKISEKSEDIESKQIEYRNYYYDGKGRLKFEVDSSINESRYGIVYKYDDEHLIIKDNIVYKSNDICKQKNEPDTFAVVIYKFDGNNLMYKYERYEYGSYTKTYYKYKKGLIEAETTDFFNDDGKKNKTEILIYRYKFY